MLNTDTSMGHLIKLLHFSFIKYQIYFKELVVEVEFPKGIESILTRLIHLDYLFSVR